MHKDATRTQQESTSYVDSRQEKTFSNVIQIDLNPLYAEIVFVIATR